MKILRLELCNFRQYKHQIIDFPQEGLIGILGLNGAGKSTLFNAIGWAFYGKIKDVKKEMIKNQNANKKDECYVEVFFEFQNKLFRLKRDLGRTNECFLQMSDGEAISTLAIGTTNLNQYVEETFFKMDYNAFCACYYAAQDEFDALVKFTPAKRVQMISQLLRIETIDEAAKMARDEYRQFELEIKEARKHLKNTDVLVQQKQVVSKEIASFLETISSIDKELEQLDVSYKNLLVKRANGEKDYQAFQSLKNNLDKINNNIHNLKTRSLFDAKKRLEVLLKSKIRFEEIKQNKEIYKELIKQKDDMSQEQVLFNEKQRLEKEINLIKKDVQEYHDEYQKIKSSIEAFNNIEEEAKKKEEEVSKTQEDIALLREQHQEFKFSLQAKKDELDKLKMTKNKFNELGSDSPCPSCERPLGEHFEEKMKHIKDESEVLIKIVKETQEKGKSIEIKGKETKNILETKQKEFKEIQKKLTEKSNLETRRKTLEKEVIYRKDKYQSLKNSFEKVKDVSFNEEKYKTIVAELKRVLPLRDEAMQIEKSMLEIPELEKKIEEFNKELNKYNEETSQIENALKKLNFDEETYRKLNQLIDDNQNKIKLHEKEKANLKAEVKILENNIKTIEEKLKENAEMEKDIKQKEQEMVLLAKLNEIYKAYKSDKLNKLAPALADIMSELMDTITDSKYEYIELDDQYNIFIYRQGVKNPLEFYSGGERKLAALCQRIAISNLLVSQTGLASFELLAMDEVFGSMDDERQDSMVEMLRNLNNIFSQILIVTHSEAVKQLFDYVLEIKQDNNFYSTADWTSDWDNSYNVDLIEQFEELEELDEDLEEDMEFLDELTQT